MRPLHAKRSAYILCTQVRPLKPTKRAIKSAGGIHLVSVGFPVGSEASNLKGIPQGTTVTKITVSGENLSAAVINLSGNALTLNAAENPIDAISVEGLNLTVEDANGTLSNPVFLAVPVGAKIAKVSVPFTKEPETMTKPSTTPQEGVDYVTIAGIKWANTPFHNDGNEGTTGWTKYIPTGFTSYWWPVGGTPDNKLTLDIEDDAAHVNWGGNWRMPKKDEIARLTDKTKTTSEWKDNYEGTGINGRLLTSTVSGEEGHSIFFPAVGYGEGAIFDLSGDYGFYRTSSLWDREASQAYEFFVRRDKISSKDPNFRCLGMAVRPISD